MKKLLSLLLLSLLLTACGAKETPFQPGMGMGGGNGMMERHHATVPDEYASLTNPVPADDDSLTRGAALYATHCASCHGDGGMGDGAAGAALDPKPAPLAHSSQMMGDDYLFWRISEGGVSFGTSMPAWKVLNEQARWDMVNYMRALGSGMAKPVNGIGGATYDPTIQAAQQAEMLAQAVEQGVITQEEADVFNTVHSSVEHYRAEHPEVVNSSGTAAERESAILEELIKAQVITQAQADAFTDIHDRLAASGLMD